MRRLLLASIAVASLTWIFACGSSGSASPDATSEDVPPREDAGGPGGDDAAQADARTECPRAPGAADRARKVVISHPFAGPGEKATAFEVLDLSTDGTLSRPAVPVTFQMGVALQTPIVFTPDGAVGLVAQDDGSIGAFLLSDSGPPVVVHAAYKDGFFASSVVVSPDGTRAWVMDQDTADNGGGVYELAIGCDGKLSSRGQVVPGANAPAMALLPGDPTKAVLAAKKAFGSPDGNDVHVVDLQARTLVGSASAFGDGKAIVSSVAVTPDDKYALIADDGILAGNRVAVASLSAGAVPAPVSVLTTPFPSAVVISPFGNAGIVLNGDATNQIHVLGYDPANTAAPFSIKASSRTRSAIRRSRPPPRSSREAR